MKKKFILIASLLVNNIIFAKNMEPTNWLDLMPPEDLEELENMEPIEHVGEEIYLDFKNNLRQTNKNLPKVMYSENTVEKFNNKEIKIGGYPVPIELNEKGQTVSLFLVPYAGACIHLPPPPPNQIILVKYDNAIRIDDTYRPIWVYGKIQIRKESNSIADSLYYINADKIYWVKANEW